MKTLYTSHYGRKHSGHRLVQISSYAPKSWNPPDKLFEPALVWRHFTTRKSFVGDWRVDYRQQLSELLASGALARILERLPEQAVLLCWERDHMECHRKVLADFLNAKNLATVIEL